MPTNRNLQGDDSEVPILPTPGGEVASKGTKKAYLKGPGVDERYVNLLDPLRIFEPSLKDLHKYQNTRANPISLHLLRTEHQL